jgi:hypothetical protein
MTNAEKRTVLLHLNPKPRWLTWLAMMILRDKVIAEGRKQLEADYRGKTVDVLRVGVERYAVGEECNGEGPILFVELGQNELLVLWGQWLYDPHVVTSDFFHVDELCEQNAWFKHFELVRLPSSGLVLSLKSIGRETVSSVGIVRAGQRLPAQPSGVFQAGLDGLINEHRPDPA